MSEKTMTLEELHILVSGESRLGKLSKETSVDLLDKFAKAYHAAALADVRKEVVADSCKDDWMVDVVNLKDVLAILDKHIPKPQTQKR